MYSRFLFALRIPALALAAVLQCLPIVRVALPATQTATNFVTIMFRWGAVAAATLGGVHAVSGASTVITTPLNQTVTNGVPLGTTQIRLITAPDQAHYWQATGLPPGLTLFGTSGTTSWSIRGTPTATGTYNVGLTAKDKIDSKADRTVTATMIINVLPGGGGGGNAPPTATAQSVTTIEDTAKAITLTGTDPDGDPLTYSIVAQPAHGTLSGTAPNVSYLPATNYFGPDSFTFRVNDGATNSASATVTITVTPVNDAPTANTQSVTTAEDTAKAITLTGADPDGDPLTYSIVTQPAHGTLSGTAPNLSYLPATNYFGSDSFTFRVNDGSLNSAAAMVSITITPVNDAPTANPQTVSTPEDTPRAITLTGSDPEDSPLTYTIVTQPAHGSLSGSPPNVTYTPNAAYSGADNFAFKVNDGSLDSAMATVTISVSFVNSAPVANAQSVSTPEDTATTITLTGSDANGDPLTYTILTHPAKGLLVGSAPNLTYTPGANTNGADSFTFRVNDGTLDSTPATVSITIVPVNDAPTANAQSVTTAEDTAIAVTLSGSDVEEDALTYAIVESPAHGNLTGSPPNVTYTPAADYHGPDSFTFIANDGYEDSAPATVTITVTPVNDPPVAMDTTTATPSGTVLTLQPLAGSTDSDGDALTIVSVDPTNGTAVIQNGTNILFTPAPAFAGDASVAYTISDGQGGSATGLIRILVTPVSTNQFSITAASPILDAQTGLYAQQVNVTNTGSVTVPAIRLTVRDLRAGVTLHNASGLNAGWPCVRYDASLNPGEGVTFVLEYYVPDRLPFSSTLEVEEVLPSSRNTNPSGATAIDRSFLDRSDPANPRFTIEFPSVPGRAYTIIYTDDLVNWSAATPSITAAASVTQWHDDGPPKTSSKPGSGNRFYRVLAAP